MNPTLCIHLLGDFLLLSDETPVTSIDLPRLQSLVAYLLLHHNVPQARSHLAYLLWPDSTDAQAHTNLRNLVHKLRQAFPDVDAFLRSERQTLTWQPSSPQASWTLDVQDFEEALAQADKARDGSEARHALEAAAKLYRGDLLPSCYEEWILPERDRLRQAMLNALGRLIELQEQERDYQAAINSAQRLLRYDPLHETTYRHLMRLYALTGDRAAALRVYHTCATLLERELGTEPGLATRKAYEQLVKIETRGEEAKEPLKATPSSAQLVGRNHEWGQLQAAWRNASAGQAHVFVLSGEAGIGKTRLAEELLTLVERQGIATAAARCYAAQGGLAYAPVATWLGSEALRTALASLGEAWLSEVARLLPDLLAERPGLHRPDPLAESWQRKHMFEAFARAMLGTHQPLLLLLDDIQWCDRETLEWLHFLLHFERRTPLLLLGTMRAEEMEPDHPLVSLLRNLRRDGLLTELALAPLNAGETASLALHLVGESLDPAAIAYLYRETEGNPLFVVEAVRAGAIEPGSDGHARAGSHMPPTVQAVIAARLAQLSPPARELVGLAAVIGRTFTFEVLAQASGNDEDTLVQGLDELWQRRIVREQGGDAYDFSHDKLREGAYTALSAARRRLLHRRVAETLEMGYGGSLDSVSGQIAAHYERAGVLPKAISYYRRAGEVAQQVYANQEALSIYQRALSLLDRLPPEQSPQDWRQEVAVRLHEDVGDIFELMGQHDSARDAYQNALAQIITPDRIRQASLHRGTAKTWEMQNLYKDALQEYRRAELALDEASGIPTLEWWREWIQTRLDRIWLHHMLAQVPEMAELVEKTRPVVEQHGTQMQQASFFMDVSLLHLRQNRYVVSEEVLAFAHSALATSQVAGSMNEIAWIRSHLAFCYTWRGDIDEAEKEMSEALDVGERTGDVRIQAFCLTYLAVIFRKRGQVEKVRYYSLQALTVATATRRPQYIGMANANLAWVAWREGKLAEAEEHAQMALKLWHSVPIASPFSPFEWIAICPLIGAALAQQQFSTAIDYARALLVPEQERIRKALATLLEAAIQAWDANQPGAAHSFLQQAANLGQKMGYF